jgi:type IV fimbrial biogenesis protein FimT
MTKGFTLVEVLLTLALILILAGLAVPSYQALVAKNRASAQVNQLISAINLARSEAVRRHQVITLCKSEDGKTCGGEWSQGWIIFVDQQVSGQVDFNDEILRVYHAVPKGSFLEWVAQRSNDYLQMDPSGATHGQAGTFYYYPNVGHKEKFSRVIVSNTGRVRIDH